MLKKVNWITILFIVFIIAVVLTFLLIKFNNKNSIQNIDDKSLNISPIRIKDIFVKNITERKVVMHNDEVLIGSNEKELENDYYDVKIYNENGKFKVHINKLWKEYDDKLYDEKYLYEVTRSINEIFGLYEVKDLNQYILEGYLISKDIKTDNYSLKHYFTQKNIKIEEIIKDKELILIIYKEVEYET